MVIVRNNRINEREIVMSKRKLKLTVKQYESITESRDWCKKNGYTGFAEYYDESIEHMAERRTLPSSAPEAKLVEDDEEMPRPE